MTTLIGDFVNRVDFKSYEDFYENFELKYNEDYNFGFDVVDKYAEIDPEKVALIWVNEEGEEHIFTFEDMKKYSNKVANLFKRLGINKGDKVMLTLKNRYEFWFCMVALHKIGAIVIPATHMLKLHDIDFRLKKANVKLVVSVEPFLIYFTSGTSGLPKMVAHKHTYSLGHIPTAKYWHNVKEDGIHHTSADTGWGKAVWGNLYGQWIAGTTVFIYDYERFNGIKLLEKIIEYKVNTFCAPPTIYRFLIKENIEGYDFSNLSYVTTAGEPLPPEVSKKFKEISGLTIKEGFGQTESTLMIGTFIWLDAKLGSIGKPSPLFHVELLDNEGEIVDIGDEGEISINVSEGVKPGLFKEYYKDPEKQAASWYDGHYHCGDTAWMDEEGYYHFIGRNDDIIKSSGYRIGPYEVESAVLSHDAVSNCAITGYPDPIRGQIVKATIILQPGYEESEELIKDIQNHVKKTTAPYKYPRLIEFVDEIPETISGKIRRVEIREKDNSN